MAALVTSVNALPSITGWRSRASRSRSCTFPTGVSSPSCNSVGSNSSNTAGLAIGRPLRQSVIPRKAEQQPAGGRARVRAKPGVAAVAAGADQAGGAAVAAVAADHCAVAALAPGPAGAYDQVAALTAGPAGPAVAGR